MTRRNNRSGQTAFCPACDEQITFRKPPKRGSHITCYECDSLLTVSSLSPLELTWAFEEPIINEHTVRRRVDDDGAYDEYEYLDDDYSYYEKG